MIGFFGQYTVLMDNKGRIALPSKLRPSSKDNPDLSGAFMLTKGLDGCLTLYPEKQWELIQQRLDKLDFTRKDFRYFGRLLYSVAVPVVPDRQGRMLIPGHLQKDAKLIREVLILGANRWIELWNPELYEEYLSSYGQSYEEVAEKLFDVNRNQESNFFHRPAMADEVLRFLVNNRNGVYFDLTVGGGGHLKFISDLLSEEALLVGVDRDPDAVTAAKKNLKNIPQKVQLINRTFNRVEEIAGELAIRKIDGILMDLGISSHQIDSPQRGFSFSALGPLDMRMGGSSSSGLTAEVIINEYSETNLSLLFKKYGESKYARRVAAAICQARRGGRITTTSQLTDLIESVLPSRSPAAMAALYQALRIEINHELDQLTDLLPQAVNLLKKNGRMVVIAYHSLEDRIVKRFFAREAKGCLCPPEIPLCVCGHKPTVRILTKKVVKPSADEIENNRRVRSARLRAVEKVE